MTYVRTYGSTHIRPLTFELNTSSVCVYIRMYTSCTKVCKKYEVYV